MREFLHVYRWALEMKYHMALYTLAAVFCKALVNALAGVWKVESITMLEMMIAAMVFAVAETWIFPAGFSGEGRRGRTVLWAVLGNGLFAGGAWTLGWFAGIPVWGGLLLLLILEFGLASMWFGVHVAMKADTSALNRQLRRYQSQ